MTFAQTSQNPRPEPRLPLGAEDIASLVQERAPGWLAEFLPTRRWFGDKTRRSTRVTVDDLGCNPSGDEYHVFLIASIAFDQGPLSRYFVPLAIVPLGSSTTPSAIVVATISTPSGEYRVVDAFASDAFHRRLIDDLSTQTSMPTARGTLTWRSTSGDLDGLVDDQRFAFHGSRVLEGEQSNTSVVYGDALFLKVFRKLQPGVNPDLEIGRFLTTRTSFRHFPMLLGEVHYLSQDGVPFALGMVQAFSPSLGDAWSITLQRLQDAVVSADDGGARERDSRDALLNAARLLGQRTGELHMALATVPDDESFAPEVITTADVARWTSVLRADLNLVLTELGNYPARLPEAVVERLRMGDIAAAAEPRLQGFASLVGLEKIRVHGDFHLGQVLWTPSGDFVILDFEGEPARPIEERRRKTSPLKDVAGMLRSFAYAAAATRLANTGAVPEAERVARRWEQGAREAFLAGYLSETVAKGARFVPSDQDGFTQALSAWELDKVVYEVHYELNNRPDWLHLPLEGLRRPQPM